MLQSAHGHWYETVIPLRIRFRALNNTVLLTNFKDKMVIPSPNSLNKVSSHKY